MSVKHARKSGSNKTKSTHRNGKTGEFLRYSRRLREGRKPGVQSRTGSGRFLSEKTKKKKKKQLYVISKYSPRKKEALLRKEQ